MPTIPHRTDCCTVIVTVDAAAGVMAELESHAREGIARFAAFEGFIAGALHRSEDGARLVQYLQWETEEHHLACMNDPRWEDVPSTRIFMDHIAAQRAKVDVRVYDVIATHDA